MHDASLFSGLVRSQATYGEKSVRNLPCPQPFSSNFVSLQAQDIETLKKFLLNKKPHVVTVAGENR